MTKIQILSVVLLIVFIGAGLWYWLSLPSTNQDDNIVLAFPVPLEFGYWEFTYAKDAGYFDEYNLNTSVIVLRSTSEMIQAVVSGDADFAGGVAPTFAYQLAGGKGIKQVWINSLVTFGLFARPGINALEDVKTVAHYAGRGSDADFLTDYFLARNELTEGEDYNEIFIGYQAAIPGLENEEFDATSAGSNSFYILQMGGIQLAKYSEEFPRWFMGGLACDESRMEQKFEAYKNYMKAVYRAQTYLMEHRDEAIEYAINTLEIEPDYAEYIYDFGFTDKYGAACKITPDIYVDDLEIMMKDTAKRLEVEEIPIEDLVDTRLWDQAKEEMGV